MHRIKGEIKSPSKEKIRGRNKMIRNIFLFKKANYDMWSKYIITFACVWTK